MNIVLKPEQQWTTDEDKLAGMNSRALYAIFTTVDPISLGLGHHRNNI